MLAPFFPIARQALTQPREAATTLMSMGVPRAALWPAFGVLVAVASILTYVTAPANPATGATISPFSLAIISGVAGAASVFAIWKVGEMMEGKGSLEETLLLTVFLQSLLLAGQVVELGIFLISPALASLFGFALLVWAFVLNLNFVAALHGFGSLWKALGCFLLATMAVAVVLLVVMAFLGISMVGTA